MRGAFVSLPTNKPALRVEGRPPLLFAPSSSLPPTQGQTLIALSIPSEASFIASSSRGLGEGRGAATATSLSNLFRLHWI